MLSTMKNIFGLLVIFSLNLVLSQKTPTISYITPKTFKDIERIAELTCSVLYAKDYPVLWVKIDKENVTEPIVLSTGGMLIIKDSRFSLRQDIDSTSYTLQIKDIQETDAGFYRCQIILGLNNKISAEVELEVLSPPIIFDNSTTKSVVVTEGQLVKLECYAGGFPTPRIVWKRQYNGILPTGGFYYRGNILIIPAIKKEDHGPYYCVAESGVGNYVQRRRRVIPVEVEFAPVISIHKPHLGQALRYHMDLECNIEAYPPPVIVWLYNGVQISNNEHYGISHFATGNYFTDTLRIVNITTEIYGDYICKATNVLGTAEGVFNLYETTKPVCPPACGRISSKNSSTASTSVNLIILFSTYIYNFYLYFR